MLLNNTKWRVIFVLSILFVAILLAGIIILCLRSGADEFGDDDLRQANSTTTADGGLFAGSEGAADNSHFVKTTKLMPKWTEVDDDFPADASSSSATTSARFSSTFSPVEEIEVPTRSEHNLQCSTPRDFTGSCPQPKQEMRRKVEEVFGKGNVTPVVRMAECALNISVTDRNERRLHGKVDFQLEVAGETAAIFLNVGPPVRLLDENRIVAWNCVDGEESTEEPICVESVMRFVDENLILLKLTKKLAANSVAHLQIARFETTLNSENSGLVLQQPLKWERDRAWFVGTLNSNSKSYLSFVFPTISQVNGTNDDKSFFKLCLEHPRDAIARSNTQKRGSSESSNALTTTCFRDTPQIPIENFAFVIFDNLRSINNDAAKEDGKIIEAFIGKYLSAPNSQWIIDETHQVLNKMATFTGVSYPLDKLTLVSSPLSSTDGTAALGLIHIKETWVEYPKYSVTHNVLIAQIVRQWMANVVTFCDKCFQDGVATYLEWLLSAELQSKVASADEFSTNSTRRFFEARNRLLQTGTSATTAAKIFAGSLKPANDCADRIAVVLFMLENTYSFTTIQKFISLIIRENAWQKCVSNSQLSTIFRQANDDSLVAQHVFESFVNVNGDHFNDFSPPPFVSIDLSPDSGLLTISQNANEANAGKIDAIPVQMTDDSQHRTQLILNTTQISSHRPAKFVVAEPNSYVRHVYNAENYENMLNCYARGNCGTLGVDAFTNALNDLCWALLSDKLENNKTSKPRWLQIFGDLSTRRRDLIRDANCLCCMQGLAHAKAQCRWTWRDTCSKISLLQEEK